MKVIKATALSALMSGLGFIYLGYESRGVSRFIIMLVTIVLLLCFRVPKTYEGGVAAYCLLWGYYCIGIIETAVVSFKRRHEDKRIKWYKVLGYLSLGYAILLPSAIFALHISGLRAVRVPASAMAPTILQGERLICDRKSGEYARGSLVLIENPSRRGVQYIRRCLAVCNDTIRIANGVVCIGGKSHAIPPCAMGNGSTMLERTVVVGEDSIWVGYDNETDCGFFGIIDKSFIRGKPVYIYESATKGRIGRVGTANQ